MTRKDYEKMAGVVAALSHSFGGDEDEVLGWVANDLAAMCAEDNPRFDRARFMTACGF